MILVDSEAEIGTSQNRFSYLISFRPKGGPAKACDFLDKLSIFWRANDLGRVKSTATIPAISTHQQLDEGKKPLASIPADLVRISIGGEDCGDLINDLEKALD